MKLETLTIHVGRSVDAATGAVTPPIQLTTTFERAGDGSYPHGHVYSRLGHPGRSGLEACLAALEGGARAITFASGSAASLAVFSLLRPGDYVVAPRECYHGTAKQLRTLIAPLGVRVRFVDMTSLPEVEDALGESPRLVWIETPSNPMLNLSDIARIAALAHGRGALVCCDNTFATPVFQRPFALGADLIVHSTTKYLGGHSDHLGGVVVVREAGALAEQLSDYQTTAGTVPSPFDCWLLQRSLATLPLRIRAHAETAAKVAAFLDAHPAVERTLYPGLPHHPGHALARTQMQGFGGVVSCCIRGGEKAAFEVAARTTLFTRATSLGGIESLIEHRASMEGPHTTTPDNLLRLSIGLEHPDDLIHDLEQALASR